MLISKSELDSKLSRELIPLECLECHNTHHRTKNTVLRILNGSLKRTQKGCFCSHKCAELFKHKTSVFSTVCGECNKGITKYKTDEKIKNFCSYSCRAKYWNKNRMWSNKHNRSKLEKWMEKRLTELYPLLEIHYNKMNAIDIELDIYIPSLKLAFELNGVFHYKPVYGKERLKVKQTNDIRKIQLCLERKIELHVIDTTSQISFREKTSQKFFDFISTTINQNRCRKRALAPVNSCDGQEIEEQNPLIWPLDIHAFFLFR